MGIMFDMDLTVILVLAQKIVLKTSGGLVTNVFGLFSFFFFFNLCKPIKLHSIPLVIRGGSKAIFGLGHYLHY